MPDKEHYAKIGSKGGWALAGTEAAKERGSKGGLAKAAKRRAAIPDDKLTQDQAVSELRPFAERLKVLLRKSIEQPSRTTEIVTYTFLYLLDELTEEYPTFKPEIIASIRDILGKDQERR